MTTPITLEQVAESLNGAVEVRADGTVIRHLGPADLQTVQGYITQQAERVRVLEADIARKNAALDEAERLLCKSQSSFLELKLTYDEAFSGVKLIQAALKAQGV